MMKADAKAEGTAEEKRKTGVLQFNNKIFVIKPINRAIFLSRKFS